MKKKVTLICCLLILWSCLIPSASPAWSASTAPGARLVPVHFFWSHGCPHCRLEKEFLARLEAQFPQVRLQTYEVSRSPENQELLKKVAQELGIQVLGVPVTIIGDQAIVGWLDENTTGVAITAAVQRYLAGSSADVVAGLAGLAEAPDSLAARPIPETITLPVFGEIQTRTISLPLLTILMGAVDGFNPCAMWVLIFLIGLLLGLEDRRRMWVLGGAFIVASAGIYFLFMTAWLNLLRFIGFIFWVRLLIGLVALGAGFYNLKAYVQNPAGVCRVTSPEKRRRVFEKLEAITQQQKFWLALGGILTLALVVNLVELICSASLPVVYLQVLTMNALPVWQFYLYILLYIAVFMFDDLIVYVAALTTLQVTGLTGKYSRFSHLLGGLVMISIGLLLIWKPEWLMFG